MTVRPLATLVLGLLFVLPVTAAGPARPAPDVTLTDGSGTAVRMADLKGRVVLVDFWASWCVPCQKSFPHIDALDRELRDRGLVVLAVNLDEVQKNADRFLEKFSHAMRVAFDPKGLAAAAFDLKAMPTTMIVDRRGRIRYTHTGYTEKTITQYRAEVLALLGEPE